jgi:GntR family transcriptional regulator
MQIHITASDGVPIYLQIVQQIKYLVASGRLAPEEELPPIRVLAEQLTVNPNTVARAYRELEQAGVVVKRRTAGTYVSDAGSPLARETCLKALAERIDALLAEARQMNVGLEEVIDVLRQRDEAMGPTSEEIPT